MYWLLFQRRLSNSHVDRFTASAADQGGLPTLEDMIGNIMDVLLKTKAIANDPLDGKHTTLFYDRVLSEMRNAHFHPGQGLNVMPGVATSTEPVRQEKELPALTPEQWSVLRPVGELRLTPIAFGRASANLSLDSERELQDLARRLKTFPRFYLRVIGHARAEGDPEANRYALAQSRAEAAAKYLIGQGVTAQRLRTETAPSAVAGGEAQAVSFAVGQRAY